eukprot:TRINITY_DN12788_c0_g1_i1.p1 TRINITY_DN12788_c0_g1~~TRINITY_DN12788_c0_g1_i1.p1  ORF type:complete len:294 (-),score=22.15 TRINITY_DN12788_c0_g1_i1:11-892(-)
MAVADVPQKFPELVTDANTADPQPLPKKLELGQPGKNPVHLFGLFTEAIRSDRQDVCRMLINTWKEGDSDYAITVANVDAVFGMMLEKRLADPCSTSWDDLILEFPRYFLSLPVEIDALMRYPKLFASNMSTEHALADKHQVAQALIIDAVGRRLKELESPFPEPFYHVTLKPLSIASVKGGWNTLLTLTIPPQLRAVWARITACISVSLPSEAYGYVQCRVTQDGTEIVPMRRFVVSAVYSSAHAEFMVKIEPDKPTVFKYEYTSPIAGWDIRGHGGETSLSVYLDRFAWSQ